MTRCLEEIGRETMANFACVLVTVNEEGKNKWKSGDKEEERRMFSGCGATVLVLQRRNDRYLYSSQGRSRGGGSPIYSG